MITVLVIAAVLLLVAAVTLLVRITHSDAPRWAWIDRWPYSWPGLPTAPDSFGSFALGPQLGPDTRRTSPSPHQHVWATITDPDYLGVGATLEACLICPMTRNEAVTPLEADQPVDPEVEALRADPAELIAAFRAVSELRRTVYCHPDALDLVKAAVQRDGVSGLVKVIASPHLLEGSNVYIVKGWPDDSLAEPVRAVRWGGGV